MSYFLDFALEQWNERGNGTPRATLLHYTAGVGVASKWLRTSGVSRSYHIEISRDGAIYLCVPLGKRAWHAGRSEIALSGEMHSDANDWTIGVALSNLGLLQRIEDEFYFESGGKLHPYNGPQPRFATLTFDNRHSVSGFWEPYTEEQIQSLHYALDHIRDAGYPEAAATLVGHESVAMPFSASKVDPGPLFPWHEFPTAYVQRTTQHISTV